MKRNDGRNQIKREIFGEIEIHLEVEIHLLIQFEAAKIMVFPPFRTAQVGLLILFLKCNGL